jgi:hypothetical protein
MGQVRREDNVTRGGCRAGSAPILRVDRHAGYHEGLSGSAAQGQPSESSSVPSDRPRGHSACSPQVSIETDRHRGSARFTSRPCLTAQTLSHRLARKSNVSDRIGEERPRPSEASCGHSLSGRPSDWRQCRLVSKRSHTVRRLISGELALISSVAPRSVVACRPGHGEAVNTQRSCQWRSAILVLSCLILT